MMLSTTNANMREQLPVFMPSPMFAALRKRVLPEGTRNESFHAPRPATAQHWLGLFFSHPPVAPVFPSSCPRLACKTSTATPHPHPPSTHGRPWLVGNFWACTSTGSWREYPGTSCNWICSARPDLPCALGGHPTHPPSTKAPHNSRAYNYTPQSAPHHRLPPFLRPASAQQPPSTKVHQTRATLPLSTAKADPISNHRHSLDPTTTTLLTAGNCLSWTPRPKNAESQAAPQSIDDDSPEIQRRSQFTSFPRSPLNRVDKIRPRCRADPSPQGLHA